MDWLGLKTALIDNYAFFGLAGSLLMVITMLSAGWVYRGKQAEKYSVLNHFISELGEVGVSKAAPVFNWGLILSGLILIPFVVGMGMSIGNIWAMLGAGAGVWAALSCMAVGFFPMNTLKPHYFVAMSYFRSGLLMVLLFGVAVFAQSPGTAVIAKSSNVAGMISLICYAAFLTISDSGKKKKEEPEEALNPDIQRERPKYWKTPILEWAVFFSTILWFFIVAVFALF